MRVRYEVFCGNVGRVHDGANKRNAEKVFRAYVEESKAPRGRASGESVDLCADGEPIREFVGSLATSEGGTE